MQEGKKEDATSLIRALIDQGKKDCEIVDIVGRNASTVSRARKRYEKELREKEIKALAGEVQPHVVSAIWQHEAAPEPVDAKAIQKKALQYELNKAKSLNAAMLAMHEAIISNDYKAMTALSKAIAAIKEPFTFLQNFKGLDK